ncbi:MAG: type IV-A pilus assembly ATPase PilB [bacterium]
MKERLGELLLKAKMISEEQLQQGLEEQKKSGGRLGFNLIKLGFLKEEDILWFLSKQYGVPTINLNSFEIDEEVVKLIPQDLAKKYSCIPVSLMSSILTLAMVDPSNVFAIDDIKFLTGYSVETVVTSESSFKRAFDRYYRKKKAPTEEINAKDYDIDEQEGTGPGTDFSEDLDDSVVDVDDFDNIVKGAVDNVEVVEEQDEDGVLDVDAPIVKLVNGLLIKAVKMGVSDIHIEPYEKSFRVRYRLDGVLRKAMGLPMKIKNAVVSRIKIMSKLDIAEKRLPQDGRIKLKLGKKKDMDFRVSVLPTLFGEKVVLRLLDKSNLQLDMGKLGFEPKALELFQDAIHSPYGMVLVTGPTGSGKTTTLYSALHQLNNEETNIMTAEDPVEFNLAGINQVQVKEQIGLTFAAALRSFLRQDPDVIMVGEIRDTETAEIGIKAALTGHLVLSTLHTNDAPGTIGRLLNMGVEPFLVSSAVILIVAQRLARRICSQCREEITVPEKALVRVGFSAEEVGELKIFKGKGCSACNNTGYKGRVALYEVMKITEGLKLQILNGAPVNELKAQARREGMRTLRDSGLQKIREGVTTIEEVLRVSFDD